jgi:hypothetical protein
MAHLPTTMGIDPDPYAPPRHEQEHMHRPRRTNWAMLAVAFSGPCVPPLVRVLVEVLAELLTVNTTIYILENYLTWLMIAFKIVVIYCMAAIVVSIFCIIRKDTRSLGAIALIANLVSMLLLL